MATSDAITAELLDKIAAARAELADLQRLAREARQHAKPQPRRIRFTKTTVRALPIQSDRTLTYWDRDVVGLGLRISPAGSKVYFLQSRTRAGRAIKVTIGRADRITAEQARETARKHLAMLALGGDPAASLREARKAERDRREAPTIDRLWVLFEAGYLPAKRYQTRRAYASWYRLHVRPALGRIKVADLSDHHIERLHRSVTEATGQSTANRVHAVLSSMLTFAVKRKLVAVNVARGAIERHHENGRERDLSDVELKSLIAHLTASPMLEARVVEILISTGARKGEVLAMRWDDLSGAWWTVPASISKSRKAVRRPLNGTAREIVGKLERRGALVFQGLSESRLDKWWQRERRAIGLDEVRLHDLRHVHASLAINAGASLASVGKLLGHGVHSAAMTARYSHLADEQLAKASAAVAERLEVLRKAAPAGSA
jgi:integrase